MSLRSFFKVTISSPTPARPFAIGAPSRSTSPRATRSSRQRLANVSTVALSPAMRSTARLSSRARRQSSNASERISASGPPVIRPCDTYSASTLTSRARSRSEAWASHASEKRRTVSSSLAPCESTRVANSPPGPTAPVLATRSFRGIGPACREKWGLGRGLDLSGVITEC